MEVSAPLITDLTPSIPKECDLTINGGLITSM